ncbi:MAG: nickel pincer cofactor biosynthesis protein LarC [Candidatus Latescibacteria bacterium]|nr:nickel pincer cofactor biosynthesis protein LarC [Candidatus Latescibacterota bacterium]
MKIAYFDCFSGISGDMVLGALVDAGLDPAALQAELDKLELPGLSLSFQRTSRQAIAATLASVCLAGDAIAPEQEHHLEPGQGRDHRHDHSHSHEHPHPHPPSLAYEHAAPPKRDHGPSHEHGHHHLGDILERIRNSRLDAEVKERACRIFERLAEAEAQVHGLPPAQVHLHEVGAMDAVADIVGAVAGLRLLGVEKVYSSALRDGTGFVRCAHGRYPVPVPGVLALCRDIPFEQTEIRAELVTPTGAAIITTLASVWGPAPPFRLERVGYGAGRRQLEEIPNVLRIRIGHTTQAYQQERAVLVEANIDDMNPEVYGYLSERLLEQGVRDVYLTPIQMKKGRPGTLLSVLAGEEQVDLVVELLLAETTTLGVRFHPVERRKLERGSITVETGYGPVRIKVGHLGERRRYAPEYEDCARLARQYQVPLLQVYEAARAALPEE